MSAKRSSAVHDLLALGKQIFFPGGMSLFGKIGDIKSTLGNFKGVQISFANFTLAKVHHYPCPDHSQTLSDGKICG